MKYHIKNKAGTKIASFEHECDRDVCLDTFIDFYGKDCGLEAVDD